ncbi:hypothetical protein QR77_39875 [Streptomyces sp. 150FB]|nr:hypothetical protein QR77_39875 [Streptomyces sp. 150FB]
MGGAAESLGQDVGGGHRVRCEAFLTEVRQAHGIVGSSFDRLKMFLGRGLGGHSFPAVAGLCVGACFGELREPENAGCRMAPAPFVGGLSHVSGWLWEAAQEGLECHRGQDVAAGLDVASGDPSLHL